MSFINFSTTQKVKATRSSLACLPCRSRHLKCDGKRPCCDRCAETGNECRYATSRRGGLNRAALAERRKQSAAADAPSSGDFIQCEGSRAEAEVRPIQSNIYQLPEATQNTTTATAEICVDLRLDTEPPALPDDYYNIEEDALINSYYANFHRFHPLVLPKKHLARLYQVPGSRDRFIPLIGVMRFIGHLYDSQEWSTPLQLSTNALLSQASQTDSVMVQCRALYSIALFWHGHTADSEREMSTATQLALDLGMFRREFATENAAGDSVLTECWRRTWWALYIVDAYYAGTLGRKHLTVLGVETTVDLPCEESEYESGEIPEPKTLQDFDCREFAIDNISFSSFAYLVGAARSAVAAITSARHRTTSEASPELISRADTTLDGWLLLLPKTAKETMDKSGNIDELMFQAQMLIHVAIVGLHRPFSDLKFNTVEDVSSCARERPPEIPTPKLVNVHTVRVLRSVEAQVRLLALPARPFSHTPFVTCMVSEGTLALLSACRYLLKGNELAIARDQIRMTIGCLKDLGALWPRTARNVREIQTIARQALALEESDSTPSSSDIPSLWDSEGQTTQHSEAGTISDDIAFSTDSFEGMSPWFSLCNLYPDGGDSDQLLLDFN